MGQAVDIEQCLKRIRRPVTIEDDVEYQLVTIRLKHAGVVERCRKKGKDIGTKKMYQVLSGDFILSGIDARNGAFGIVPPELDGAVVTNDFWYFDVNERVISTDLFLALTQTNWFDHICRLGSDGTTQRIRLQRDKFYNQSITLPTIQDQPAILKRLHRYKRARAGLTSEIEEQEVLLAKYRQAILQEAIEGKLTEDWRAKNQDVEPAFELLRRIATEKAELVRQKKIRKPKALTEINPDEVPFEIPESWAWCRLGDAALFERGKSKHRPRNAPHLYSNGTYPFVQTGEVARSKHCGFEIKSYAKAYNEEGLAQSRLWPKGALCITIAANIAETGFLGMDACIPDSVVGVTSLTDESQLQFIQYYMRWAKDEIQRIAPATAQKNINLGIISELLFPIPPLAEHQEIARRVEVKFALCDSLDSEINGSAHSVETLSTAILQELFGQNGGGR